MINNLRRVSKSGGILKRPDNTSVIDHTQLDAYNTHTPVLVDDIISTARTMIETVGHLKKAGMKSPVCIGENAVFAKNAYEDLEKAGAEVVTCNTIPHDSNQIDLSKLLAEKITETMRNG